MEQCRDTGCPRRLPQRTRTWWQSRNQVQRNGQNAQPRLPLLHVAWRCARPRTDGLNRPPADRAAPPAARRPFVLPLPGGYARLPRPRLPRRQVPRRQVPRRRMPPRQVPRARRLRCRWTPVSKGLTLSRSGRRSRRCPAPPRHLPRPRDHGPLVRAQRRDPLPSGSGTRRLRSRSPTPICRRRPPRSARIRRVTRTSSSAPANRGSPRPESGRASTAESPRASRHCRTRPRSGALTQNSLPRRPGNPTTVCGCPVRLGVVQTRRSPDRASTPRAQHRCRSYSRFLTHRDPRRTPGRRATGPLPRPKSPPLSAGNRTARP